jgi:hypothetical protein
VQHIIIGLISVILGVFGIISWWADFGLVLRGLIPFLLLIGGLVAIGSGLTREKLEESEEGSHDSE